MSKYKYAVQLYSVKEEIANDMTGTFKKLRKMGYKGVEFYGPLAWKPAEIVRALDISNLECCGWKNSWDLMLEDKFEQTMEYFKAIGNKISIVSVPGEMMKDKKSVIETAEKFNKLSKKLFDYGMKIGYHNHTHELEYFENSLECPYTVFFDNTEASVIAEMDIGHVLNARTVSMIDLVKRYAGRSESVHLKPYSLEKGKTNRGEGYETMIGQDDVPWGGFMPLCKKIGGTEWFIVEYESEKIPELEGVKQCYDALAEMENNNVI